MSRTQLSQTPLALIFLCLRFRSKKLNTLRLIRVIRGGGLDSGRLVQLRSSARAWGARPARADEAPSNANGNSDRPTCRINVARTICAPLVETMRPVAKGLMVHRLCGRRPFGSSDLEWRPATAGVGLNCRPWPSWQGDASRQGNNRRETQGLTARRGTHRSNGIII